MLKSGTFLSQRRPGETHKMNLAQFFKLLAVICWAGTRALTALSSLGGMYLISAGPKPDWSSIVMVAYVVLSALMALVGTGIFHCLARCSVPAASPSAIEDRLHVNLKVPKRQPAQRTVSLSSFRLSDGVHAAWLSVLQLGTHLSRKTRPSLPQLSLQQDRSRRQPT